MDVEQLISEDHPARAYDLARAVGRKAEAVVGDVEIAIGADGEAGGKEKAGGDDRACAVFVYADDLAETRSGAGSADGVFEDIQVVFVVEVETEDGVETGGPETSPQGVILRMTEAPGMMGKVSRLPT